MEAVAWDQPGVGVPMLATMTPQAAIAAGLPEPSECDIVVVVLWSRMGTPLPIATYRKPDGSAYFSGTEWEYLNGLEGAKQHGRPQVLVYRRTEPVLLDPDDPQFEDKLSQRRNVEAFFGSFRNSDGSISTGHNEYNTPDDFREQLDHHLRVIIDRLLKNSRPTVLSASPQPPPLWEGSPFPGLRAFTPDDAPIFFGRGRETDELLLKLRDPACRFLAIVGASGSGKSSLVGAGLIPRLRDNAIEGAKDWMLPSVMSTASRQRKQWTGLRFTPGELGGNPFLSLAARLAPILPDESLNVLKVAEQLEARPTALADYIGQVLESHPCWAESLIFIDQFEELFTLIEKRYCAPLIAMLKETLAAGRVRLVLTMRADFYPHCLEFPVLTELLRDGSFPLAAPRMGTLCQMMVGPATRAGLDFEAGLPERILDDTGSDTGTLALLAFALRALYDGKNERNVLSHGAYERIGGVRGAIAQCAEETYNNLSRAEQELLMPVFRELIDVDERRGATRRRVSRSMLPAGEAADNLVNAFTTARLLVTDRTSSGEAIVEVAHEALLREWPRLSDWIAERAEDLHIRRRAESAADEWQRSGSEPSQLWHHELLEPVYTALDRIGIDRTKLAEPLKSFLRPEAERLLEELEKPETTHYRRAEIGDRLNCIGDPRPGVGLLPDGVPDIYWCPVPGGNVRIENIEGAVVVDEFFISRYPISYQQYRAFLDDPRGYYFENWWMGLEQKEKLAQQYRPIGNGPAESLSWYDAVAFSRWLSHKLGYEVRLPTEWEWYQAATGGNPKNKYPWGEKWIKNKSNTSESGLGRTTAVGIYLHGISPVGAFDMVGNVWEWCLNKWPVPYELTNQGLPRFGLEDTSVFSGAAIYGIRTTPTIKSEIERPVVRGGSWDGIRDFANCAVRDLNSPHDRRNDLGFRLVRNVNIEPVESKDYDQGAEPQIAKVELKPKRQLSPSFRLFGRLLLIVLLAFLVLVAARKILTHVNLSLSGKTDMVLVPAGTFTMGSPQDEIDKFTAECTKDGADADSCRDWFERELPQHRVFLNAYYIDRFEVTNQSFAHFVQQTGYRTTAEQEGYGYTYGEQIFDTVEGANWQNPNGSGRSLEPLHPVVMVSWHDADAYCRWADKRLPTEAEWEKAARSTDGRLYPWGNNWDAAKANAEMTQKATTPVGSYPQGASLYGAQDMAGNITEWVQDVYAPYSSGYDINPTGPTTGVDRVLRGGNWTHFREDQRPAHRSHFKADERADVIGFRCAR